MQDNTEHNFVSPVLPGVDHNQIWHQLRKQMGLFLKRAGYIPGTVSEGVDWAHMHKLLYADESYCLDSETEALLEQINIDLQERLMLASKIILLSRTYDSQDPRCLEQAAEINKQIRMSGKYGFTSSVNVFNEMSKYDLGVRIRLSDKDKTIFGMLGKEKNFQWLDLSNQWLIDLDLSELNMAGVNLSDTRIRNTTFKLSSLYGANFTKSNISDTSFGQALLDRTCFRMAKIANVEFPTMLREVSFESAVMKRVYLHNCYLFDVSFKHARIFHSTFGGARMKGINFNWAVLKDVTFMQARCENVIGSPVLLEGITYPMGQNRPQITLVLDDSFTEFMEEVW